MNGRVRVRIEGEENKRVIGKVRTRYRQTTNLLHSSR